MNNKYQKKQQQTALEIIILGLFKIIWWLVRLPFSKKQRNSGLNQSDKNYILDKRLEIESKLSSDSHVELTHILFESDKLLDYYLKSSGFGGDTMGDRLRSAEDLIDRTTYNNLWEAHKIRNVLAHESGARVNSMELKSAVIKILNYLKNV